MDDLLTWLRAQLDDEERTAEDDALPSGEAAWVRANVNAKRRIIDECDWRIADLDPGMGCAEKVLAFLAQPYADRPGYRNEWRR